MKQLTVLSLSLLCCAALAAGSKHAGRPSCKASSLTGTVKSILPAAYDSGWTPISLPDYNGDRICQACAYDPVHDKLYMYGGDNGGMYGGDAGVGREVSCLARYDEVSDLARYDPVTDTWKGMSDMSIGRGWIKGLYCRGKLYALGGYSSSGSALSSCEAYDIAADSWFPIGSMPEARFGYAAVCWRDSLIFLIGGGSSGATSDIRIYNPFTNTWIVSPEQAPDTLWMDDACIIGDTIYIAGSSDRAWLMKGGIDPANPQQINWSSGPALPCSTRFSGPTVALAGKVYFFGGFVFSNETVTREGWVYDPRTLTFDTLPLLPAATGTGTARCCFGVSRDSAGEIYKLAGDDNGDWNPPNCTYFRLRIPIHPDAGVTQILAPAAIVQPGDTVTPSAWVRNFGSQAEGFRVVMRIDTTYANLQDVCVGSLDSTFVDFAPWVAVQSGAHTAKCSTMLAGDANDSNDACTKVFTVSAVAVEQPGSAFVPKVFALDVPSPNPSRDAVTIHYALPKAADISLKLYDATGKLRAVLDQGRKAAGEYSATFDIRHSRLGISSVIYFVRLDSPGFERTRKVVIAQ